MSGYDKCIPTDEERWIGTVYDVQASRVIATMPEAAAPVRHHHGTGVQAGEVSEHVFIPVDRGYVFGRISRVWLETGERLYADGRTAPREVHPMAEIQLLSDVDQATLAPSGAVARPPRVGAAVYSAHPDALAQVLNMAGRGTGKVAQDGERLPGVRLGKVPGMHDSEELEIAPEALFARHCAVLGQTGGGKSWTLARLVESCRDIGGRVLLLDATGEFRGIPAARAGVQRRLASKERTLLLMSFESNTVDPGTPCSFPFSALTEDDVFALLMPSAASQAPTLRNALTSLRLLHLVRDQGTSEMREAFAVYGTDGNVSKQGKPRRPFEEALKTFPKALSPRGSFDFSALAGQIERECLKSPWGDKFGSMDERLVDYCTTLVMRIHDILDRPYFSNPSGDETSVFDSLDVWMGDNYSPSNSVCRLSLAAVPYDRNLRAIAVNAIGRRLLDYARAQDTAKLGPKRPLLVVLDEAHQFLGKSIGDDFYTQRLDAFETIAREGRKYGLLLCLATQRPRDLQESVLSQVGAMIVHRMAHPEDQRVVTQAMRDAERGAGAFLSTLGQGHAIVVSGGLPVPIPVEIGEPEAKPDSLDPNLSAIWANQLKSMRKTQDVMHQHSPEPTSPEGDAGNG